MNSISLNMKYWDDGQPNSTRLRNVMFCWPKLKELSIYLKENGVNCKENLYDFSPEKILEDSIHVSYPLGVYKKAEKTNIILDQNLSYDFFMMIDCDAFFDYEDFPKLLSLIKNIKNGDVYTFDLAKLDNNISDYIIENVFYKEMADWSYAYSGNKELGPLRSHMGGLGGVYICDTKLLKTLGGFDIKYEVWGGEDGDMLGRIMYSNINHKINSVREFAPFHLPHFCDWGNENYYKR